MANRNLRNGTVSRIRLISEDADYIAPSQIQYLLFERTRLIRALQQLYKQTLSGEPWRGDPVTELESDGPSIHEILQRLETDNLTKSGMGIIATKAERNLALSWPESQERRMSDIQFPRGRDIFTKDAGSKGTFLSPKAIEVTTPIPIDTPVIEVPVRPINGSSAVFSTTSPLSASTSESLEFPQDYASHPSTVNSFGDVYLPPWMFCTQSIDSFAPNETHKFGMLHLP